MASKNRGTPVSFLCFFFIICNFSNEIRLITAQNTPVFACDILHNTSLIYLRFCDRSFDFQTRVNDLIQRLTLQEKIGFLVSTSEGCSRLGIPKYEWWSEALHGVSDVGPGTRFVGRVNSATSFPQVLLTAASFDVKLFELIGKVVSTEARAMHNVGLAGLTFWSPNVNIFRDPRWGRGQETPGEDPILSSKYGAAYVRGLQERDDGDKLRLKVAASCKHYTAYDVDNWKGVQRFTFNAQVTLQDLIDTFDPPFRSCVYEGNVASVMCSYNKVNGKPTCGDPLLLKGVIRGMWKLNGYIVSDCDSVEVLYQDQHYTKTPEEAAALSIKAGLDLDCGSFLSEHTEMAVKKGLLEESYINTAISNNFMTLMRLGFFDGDPRKQLYGELGPKDVCTKAHQELALEAAREGIVLLKNSPGSLPLSPTKIKSLAVIGPNADVDHTMLGNYEGKPCKYVKPLQGLSAVVPTVYRPGCVNVACSTAQIDSAKKVAAVADAVVMVMGTDQSIEREFLDRVNITLPGQQAMLVSAVANVSRGPVILVIMSGGGVDIQFAKDNPKVTSILWVGFPGEKGGAALADVIFGYHNPSGRLPMTWYPQSYVDKVAMTNMNMRPDFATGYPGRTYRFYRGPTIYEFGYGLSYCPFRHQLVHAPKQVALSLKEKHECRSSKCLSLDVADQMCKNLAFDVHLKVKNEGKMGGSHTVFLFSSPPSVHNAPQKHLVAFEKVKLSPQEEGLVKFNVDVCKHLSMADELGNKKVALGEHLLHVGDLKHSFNLNI